MHQHGSRRARERAFTLLELAAVLALIGLLAAAAVPMLSHVVDRGRALEAETITEAIAHAELRHRRDRGAFVACPATPAQPPAGTSTTFDASAPCWRDLGVAVAGPVRYSYSVELVEPAPGGGAAGFRVVAVGDLDGDGALSRYVRQGADLALTVTDPLE